MPREPGRGLWLNLEDRKALGMKGCLCQSFHREDFSQQAGSLQSWLLCKSRTPLGRVGARGTRARPGSTRQGEGSVPTCWLG